MKKIGEIKRLSRDQMKGNWLKSVLLLIVVNVIFSLLSVLAFLPDVIGIETTEYMTAGIFIISFILSFIITFGINRIFYEVSLNKKIRLKNIFCNAGMYKNLIVYTLFMDLLFFVISAVLMIITVPAILGVLYTGFDFSVDGVTVLFSEINMGVLIELLIVTVVDLFVIIYFYIMYSMTPYIIYTDSEKVGAVKAIKLSRKLTKKKKWKIFCFGLSFIGWYLLTVITAGIAGLYMIPYMYVSFSNLYKELLRENTELTDEYGLGSAIVEAEPDYDDIFESQLNRVEESLKYENVNNIVVDENENAENGADEKDGNNDAGVKEENDVKPENETDSEIVKEDKNDTDNDADEN